MMEASPQIITIDGETADVQSYSLGFHGVNGFDGKFDVIAGGRYADRLEKRDDEWRIIGRKVITD